MKKLILTLTLVISSCYMFAQKRVQVKGEITSVIERRILDNTNNKLIDTVISISYPTHSSIILSDEKLVVKLKNKTTTYYLFDKDTTQINDNWVISYMSNFGDDLKLIIASDVPDCCNNIYIAIFSFIKQDNYYIEYSVQLKK